MRHYFIILTMLLFAYVRVFCQTNDVVEDNKKVKKHKNIWDISGPADVVGLFYYDVGIDNNNSSGSKKIVPAGASSTINYHSNAAGIRASGQSSIIGGFCATKDYKIIIGEILNVGLTYGKINTNDVSQENRYYLNTGTSWFVIDYELGYGLMTNFSADWQFGANFIITRGSLDRSYPINGGRANSNVLFRYRYKRILTELEMEGYQFGYQGLKNPKIIGLSCKILERKRNNTVYHTPHFIGFGFEYMNTTIATNTETNHLKMLNFKISIGKIF